MIPLLAALPAVQGVLGGVVGTVANVFSPSEPTAPAPTNSLPFSTALKSAAAAAPSTTSPGILRADQLNQMSGVQVQTWAKGLAGHHIDATDFAGHTVSGTVTGVTQNGSDISLTIGGHPVSLSELKQVSWSAMPA